MRDSQALGMYGTPEAGRVRHFRGVALRDIGPLLLGWAAPGLRAGDYVTVTAEQRDRRSVAVKITVIRSTSP